MNEKEEFERLKREHEERQLNVNLTCVEDTIKYLTEFTPMELFFKRLYEQNNCESDSFWSFANYYDEAYRFKFQFVNTILSVARHFRYDRHIIHSHDFFQINYCDAGSGRVILSGNSSRKDEVVELNPGDFNIIAPNTDHMVQVFSDDCVIIKYYIRRSTFERTFFALLEEDDILSTFFRNAIQGGVSAYITFRTGDDAEIRRLALTIYSEMMNHREYYGVIGEAKLTELFCLLVRDHIGSAETRFDRKRDSDGSGRAARIFAYLRHNYAEATLDSAARELGYTKSYLCRLISGATGMTFSELLNEMRINAAKKLLLGNHDSVAEVGRLVGYNSVEHFHRMFKASTGMSPREWVSEMRNK